MWQFLCLQNSSIVPGSCISDIQNLLLSVMCNFASIFICKKSSGVVTADQTERCFVEAATVFCKVQHLIYTVPVKTQVRLLSACENLTSSYGFSFSELFPDFVSTHCSLFPSFPDFML